MATNIYQKGLQLFVEANELSGADATAVSSFTDLSGNGRHLTASADQPLIKANAVNGKKSIIWNGAKNPLKWEGNLNIRCGFAVVKIPAPFTTFAGVLTSLTSPILVGTNGSGNFFDNLYNYFEYRLNERIYSRQMNENGDWMPHIQPAPVASFGIIYFKFWTDLMLDGVQLGQDRSDASRKLTGEIAMLALYDRDFCEREVRKMSESIAYSYQLPITAVFPYQGQKNDARNFGKRILSDEQDEPNVRIKRYERTNFQLSFQDRTQKEFLHAHAYYRDKYPSKRFLYRDYSVIPPVDTVSRITGDLEWSGATNFFNYGFQAVESATAPETSVPSAQVLIPDEFPPVVSLIETGSGPYSGDVVFDVTAFDLNGVVSIQLLIDGVLIDEQFVSEYTFTLDSTAFAEGFRSVQAIARDAAGNIGVSSIVTVEFIKYVLVDSDGVYLVDEDTENIIEG